MRAPIGFDRCTIIALNAPPPAFRPKRLSKRRKVSVGLVDALRGLRGSGNAKFAQTAFARKVGKAACLWASSW